MGPLSIACVVVQSPSRVSLFATPWSAAHQDKEACPSLSHYLKLMSTELMIHTTISFSVAPFSSCPQSFPASRSFPVSRLLASNGHRIRASASALPMNIQGYFPLALTSLISLLSKGLSRVFSNPTVRKHQVFGEQRSLWSSCHNHTWLLEKP